MSTKSSTVEVDAAQLVYLLNRALNTLDPQKIPPWALTLTDNILPTDKTKVVITRVVLPALFSDEGLDVVGVPS